MAFHRRRDGSGIDHVVAEVGGVVDAGHDNVGFEFKQSGQRQMHAIGRCTIHKIKTIAGLAQRQGTIQGQGIAGTAAIGLRCNDSQLAQGSKLYPLPLVFCCKAGRIRATIIVELNPHERRFFCCGCTACRPLFLLAGILAVCRNRQQDHGLAGPSNLWPLVPGLSGLQGRQGRGNRARRHPGPGALAGSGHRSHLADYRLCQPLLLAGGHHQCHIRPLVLPARCQGGLAHECLYCHRPGPDQCLLAVASPGKHSSSDDGQRKQDRFQKKMSANALAGRQADSHRPDPSGAEWQSRAGYHPKPPDRA
uniref:Transposase n=1 Tax=Parastrongyloides trichosuri TaxID=131310 RepID=A0A0N4ZAR2_PARTI